MLDLKKLKNMNFLYRGVSLEIHLKYKGKLVPKGLTFKHPVKYGSRIAKYGSGITYGYSEINAVIGHQTNSTEFPTSGVSTTPHFERARLYATKGTNDKGIVYKINREDLAEYEVREYIVNKYAVQPTVPEDDEVILVHKDYGPLPKEIIIDIIEV